MQQAPIEAKLSLASMVGVYIAEVANILTVYPMISYGLMAAFGSLASHLMDVENAGVRDFRSFCARFFVTEFACIMLYIGWAYMNWPLSLGLLACGIVAVWPRQMLEFARDTLKAILTKRTST